MSTMSPPLTTSMTRPLTMPSASLISSILPQARSYWARFLDRTRRPSLSSLVMTSASMGSPRFNDLRRVDVVSDRQLASRDDALRLVADVEEDLVSVDSDDGALDELPVLDGDHRRCVRLLEADLTEVVVDDLTGNVLAVLVERAELAGIGGGDGGSSSGTYRGLVGHVGFFSVDTGWPARRDVESGRESDQRRLPAGFLDRASAPACPVLQNSDGAHPLASAQVSAI